MLLLFNGPLRIMTTSAMGIWYLTAIHLVFAISSDEGSCIDFCHCHPEKYTIECHGSNLDSHKITVVRFPRFPLWTKNLSIIDFHVFELEPYAFPSMPNLESLTLNRNNLGRIDPFAFTQLPVLVKLDLHENEFSDLPVDLFREMSQLRELDLSYTKLRNISAINANSFYPGVTLRQLSLAHCPLKSTIGAITLPPIQTLDLSGLGVAQVQNDLVILQSGAKFGIERSKLSSLYLNENPGLFIDDAFMRDFHKLNELSICCGAILTESEVSRLNEWLNLTKLDIHATQIEWVIPDKRRLTIMPRHLRYLDVRQLGLTSFTLGSIYTALEYLYLDRNELNSFDMSVARHLHTLSIEHNSFSELPSTNYDMSSLTHLHASYNFLPELSRYTFVRMRNLRFLDVSNNRIHTVSPAIFGMLRRLEDINLANNFLQTVAFEFHIPSLHTVNLGGNFLNCDLGEPIRLTGLEAAPSLTRFDVSDNPKLLHSTGACTAPSYQCWPNWLSELSRLTSLRYLNLANTSLHTWPLKEFLQIRKLQILDVSYNNITLDALEFPWNNSNPRELSGRINTLLLTGNNISSLPARVVNHLRRYANYVDLRYNPLICECHLPEELKLLAPNLTTGYYSCFSTEVEDYMSLRKYVDTRQDYCTARITFLTVLLVIMSVIVPCCCSVLCSLTCLWKLRSRRSRASGTDRIVHQDTSYTLLSRMSPTSDESPVDV